MARLSRHQILLDREAIPRAGRGAVRFTSSVGNTRVNLDFVRWVEMGSPDQVVATITPGPDFPRVDTFE
jgi:hypothetical protein